MGYGSFGGAYLSGASGSNPVTFSWEGVRLPSVVCTNAPGLRILRVYDHAAADNTLEPGLVRCRDQRGEAYEQEFSRGRYKRAIYLKGEPLGPAGSAGGLPIRELTLSVYSKRTSSVA